MNKKILAMSVIAASMLVGCASNSAQPVSNAQKHTIEFEQTKIPLTDSEKRMILSSSYMKLDNKKYPIAYNTILRSGDKIGEGTFGLLYGKDGKALTNEDGSPMISYNNDFSSLLPVGDKLFMVSHFESRPAAMYLTELNQNSDGKLTAVNTKNIDFSDFNGLWVPCAGSVTPWGSHLGSEEYEPDAAAVKPNGSINDYYDAMGAYFGGDLKKLNPYDYGWTTEVKVLDTKGDLKVQKHYSMGRFAHELGYVMPDEKTVFLSDDGTNVALFMFVADKAKDLTSGTLYAAKWIQKSNKGAGSADLKWVNLGHTNDSYIKGALDSKIKFNDIFESDSTSSTSCAEGHLKLVNTTTGEECLKVKPGMATIASRLEARRYAALKGATTEFRKMEGITYNPNSNNLYISMSAVEKGMEDFKKKGKYNPKYDIGGNNDIQVKYNPCGTVYSLNMNTKTTKDTNGNVIDSKFVPDFMYGLISGKPDKTVEGNKCSIAGIANPDNITFIPNTDTLIIGEDTGSGHQNDSIWSYNIKDKQLTRIQTTPYGSETTSAYYYNNVGGHGYIMSVVQHPYGEGDALTKEKDMPKKAHNKNDMRAYTGYIGPLPVITK